MKDSPYKWGKGLIAESKIVDTCAKIVLSDDDIEKIKSGETVEFYGGKIALSYKEIKE